MQICFKCQAISLYPFQTSEGVKVFFLVLARFQGGHAIRPVIRCFSLLSQDLQNSLPHTDITFCL